MNTQQIVSTLTRHLEGFEIPKVVRQEVRSMFSNFLGQHKSVLSAYEALEVLRKELTRICDANKGILNARQRRALNRAYCVLYGDSSTVQSQIQKDVKAISGPEPPNALRLATRYIRRGMESVPVGDTLQKGVTYRGIFPVHELIVDKLVARKKAINNVTVARRIAKEWERCQAVGINNPDVWSRVFPYFTDVKVDVGSSLVDAFVGQVSYSQEPGMKLRLFASPYLFLQAALEPLKRCLQDLCKQIPEDYHGDQDAGREFVRQQLALRKTAFCYDLSSATHRFPFSAQLKMLHLMKCPKWATDIFVRASKCPYNVDVENLEQIKWEAGQPLGTGPSFFVFSLAHHLLVRGIFTELGKDPSGGYALLGDDIVIFDPDVAKCYAKVMALIGCEINFSKSSTSNDVAEFAGSLITPKEIINVGKWRTISHTNVLSANSLWSRPEARYRIAVSYLNQTMPADIRMLIAGDLSSRLMHKVNKLTEGKDPQLMLSTVCSELESMGYTIAWGTVFSRCLLSRFAGWIRDQYQKCPQCWPALAHYCLPSTVVINGIKGLLRAAVEDQSTPIWWGDLLRFMNLPIKPYTEGGLLRLLTTIFNRAFLVDSRLAMNESSFANKVSRSHRKWAKVDRIRRFAALDKMVADGVLSWEAVEELNLQSPTEADLDSERGGKDFVDMVYDLYVDPEAMLKEFRAFGFDC